MTGSKNRQFKKILALSIILIALSSGSIALASTAITFNVPLGDSEASKGCTISATENNCLGIYLKAWYGFAIGIAGILATAVIMYGGFKYLTSRGDKSAASKGKEYIISAITGLSLVFLSYTIISLVNPTLTVIRMPALPSFKDTSGVDISAGSQEVTANAAPGGQGTFTGSGLKPEAKQLLSDLPGAVLSSEPCRPTDTGSNHALCEAIDVRATPEMTAYVQSLINGRPPSYTDARWGPIYEFPNFTINGHTYPMVRLIDERGSSGIFHWDLGKH